MSAPGLWSRIRKGRLVQVLLVYLGVSWVILQVIGDLRETLGLPEWLGPVAFILLVIGLVIVLATAWIQSLPVVDRAEARQLVPTAWELDLKDAVQSVGSGRLPHLTWARVALGGVVAFGLLFGGAGLFVLLRGGVALSPAPVEAADAPAGVAVLPFEVLGSAPAEWREGLVDLLSTGLDGAAGLRAIDSRTVFARWAELPDPDVADEATALGVARQTRARWALLGSAVAVGPEVRLTANVHELDTGERLGQVQVQGLPDDILTLVDELAVLSLGRILGRDASELPRVDVASVTTTSLPALRAYLEGESAYRRGEFVDAVAAFERAVAEDSSFALAYYQLSNAYGWSANMTAGQTVDAASHAYRLVDRLPEREALLVRASYESGRFSNAGLAMLQEGVRKYPDDADMWYQLGDTYVHVLPALGSPETVEDALQHAVDLAPRFAPYQIHLVELAIYGFNADSALAAERVARYEELSPNSVFARRFRLGLWIAYGDDAHRTAAFDSLAQAPDQIGGIRNYLLPPDRFEVLEQFTRAAARATGSTYSDAMLAGDMIRARGQFHRMLDAVATDPNPARAFGVLVSTAARGVTVPAELLDSLAQQVLDNPDPFLSFQVAWYAAERRRWNVHDDALARMQAAVDSLAATPDSGVVALVENHLRAVEGYGIWKRGRATEAAALLTGERQIGAANPLSASWTASLLIELGRWRDAERFLRPHMAFDPIAGYRLGQIYEELGERENAREAYEFFVSNWAEADEELQPMVEEARTRLAALRADTG